MSDPILAAIRERDERAPCVEPVCHPTAADRRYLLGLIDRLTPPPGDGWHPFGTHVDCQVLLEFFGMDEGGLPVWERVVPRRSHIYGEETL